MWKQYLKDYFNFTAKERSGILLLVVVITILNVLPFLNTAPVNDGKLEREHMQAVAALQKDSVKIFTLTEKRNGKREQEKDTKADVRLFSFDPNTISREQWIELGIKEKTAQTIRNYISKGGSFRSANDLLKIYGLPKNEVERLRPYVTISDARPNREKSNANKIEPQFTSFKEKAQNSVEVNSADTSEFISLPGIGGKLAKRIIAYREKLGGFYSVNQVGETYFLPDTTFVKIKKFLNVNPSLIAKININKADFANLVSHPYIDKNLANAIIQYRKQHGDFLSLDDIKKIDIIDNKIYNKVHPYLATD